MTPPARRSVFAILLALAACLLVASGASASSDPQAGQLTGVVVGADRRVSGLLTMPGGALDAGTLSVTVGGGKLPVRTIPVEQARRATMIIIDTSGSMGASGMETVRTAVDTFLKAVPADVEVGVVAFSGHSSVVVPLTRDRARVTQGVAGLTSEGDTAIFDAVTLGLQQLGSGGDRSIVLLSDGTDNRSVATKAVVVDAIKSKQVRVQAVAFKTGSDDVAVLGELAAAGRGPVTAADDTAAVSGAFQSAGKALAAQVRWVVQPSDAVFGKQTIVISGTATGQPFSASANVDLGVAPPHRGAAATGIAAPVPTAPPVPSLAVSAPVALGLPLQVVLGLAAVFVGLLGAAAALLAPLFRSKRSVRVAAIDQYLNPAANAAVAHNVSASALSEGLVSLGDRVMEGRTSTSATMSLLQRADLPFRAGEWWLLRIGAVIAGVAAGLLLLSGALALVGAIVGLLLGFFAPQFVLRFLAKRRARMFERQLPDVLTLVASSLSTGFSLLQALDAVAHDSAEPASKEFSRAMAESRIGSDVDDALERMADRMESSNMKWTAMAIRIQRQVGGNLAETLRTTAGTLRDREALGRQVRALSAEGRLSAYILIALPIGIFFYSLKTNYEYISLLWSNMIGYAMMAAGLVSLVIGIFWMRKVVEVEV